GFLAGKSGFGNNRGRLLQATFPVSHRNRICGSQGGSNFVQYTVSGISGR
ncbi:19816_t:CDS:1, partial [Dentiscutata erythropus]